MEWRIVGRNTQVYQRGFYFQNAVRSHYASINVISFTFVRKVRPFLRRFSRKSQMLNIIICRSFVLSFTRI